MSQELVFVQQNVSFEKARKAIADPLV